MINAQIRVSARIENVSSGSLKFQHDTQNNETVQNNRNKCVQIKTVNHCL